MVINTNHFVLKFSKNLEIPKCRNLLKFSMFRCSSNFFHILILLFFVCFKFVLRHWWVTQISAPSMSEFYDLSQKTATETKQIQGHPTDRFGGISVRKTCNGLKSSVREMCLLFSER